MKDLILIPCDANRNSPWSNFLPGVGNKTREYTSGWRWGEGDGTFLQKSDPCLSPGAIWVVVEVDRDNIIHGNTRVQFSISKGIVVFSGDQKSATDYLLANGGEGKCVIGASITVGDHQLAIVGDHGTAIAGHHGTAIAGNYGTAIAGRSGVAQVRQHGRAIVGDNGIATGDCFSTVCAGRNSVLRGSVATTLDRHRNPNITFGIIGQKGLLPYVEYELVSYNTFYLFVPTIDSIVKFGLNYFFNKNNTEYILSFLEENFSDFPDVFRENYNQLMREIDSDTKEIIDGFMATVALKA